MNISKLSLVIAIGLSGPVGAAQDAQVMQQTRKAQMAQQAATASSPCAASRGVLPISYGPRAQTTPAQNKKLRASQEAGCKAAGATARLPG